MVSMSPTNKTAIELIQKRLVALRNVRRFGEEKRWERAYMTEKEVLSEIKNLEHSKQTLLINK